MYKLAVSCHLSGEDFDPDLLLSRLSLKHEIRHKNKAADIKPFGNESERGQKAYGYGALTLLDTDVLEHETQSDADIEDFLRFIGSFLDIAEEYGVEDVRLALTVGYGQQCSFRLSRATILECARLGQPLTVTAYQNKQLAAAEQETMPALPVIAETMDVAEETFIHIIKPHIINADLYSS
jgi:hypothetical protein